MPESYVQWTMSVGEAERIQRALYDAHYNDDAADLLELIEDGPHLTHAQISEAASPPVLQEETGPRECARCGSPASKVWFRGPVRAVHCMRCVAEADGSQQHLWHPIMASGPLAEGAETGTRELDDLVLTQAWGRAGGAPVDGDPPLGQPVTTAMLRRFAASLPTGGGRMVACECCQKKTATPRTDEEGNDFCPRCFAELTAATAQENALATVAPASSTGDGDRAQLALVVATISDGDYSWPRELVNRAWELGLVEETWGPGKGETVSRKGVGPSAAGRELIAQALVPASSTGDGEREALEWLRSVFVDIRDGKVALPDVVAAAQIECIDRVLAGGTIDTDPPAAASSSSVEGGRVVPAPADANAESWIIAVSDWVPRREVAELRRERDDALAKLAALSSPGDQRRYHVIEYRPEGSCTISRVDDLATAFGDARPSGGDVYDTVTGEYVSPDDHPASTSPPSSVETGGAQQLVEFDAWLSMRGEFAEVLTAFRRAFGTDTSAAPPVETGDGRVEWRVLNAHGEPQSPLMEVTWDEAAARSIASLNPSYSLQCRRVVDLPWEEAPGDLSSMGTDKEVRDGD